MCPSMKKTTVLDFYDMESPEATELRRLLRNINNSENGSEKRTLLVTSSVLSEGKSIIASLLAITAARHKRKKTLLIDFDLRRPTVHKLYGVSIEKGIADILIDGVSARSVIKNTSVERLDIITAGRILTNASEYIDGAGVHRIMEEMKFYYDLILVDSPPLVPVMDPLILLDELDGAVMVIKAGATQKSVVSRACDLLATQKGKFVGVVVNNLNQALPYYYDYSYYGYSNKPSGK
jgi:protein-tyrosine kinase